MATVFTGTVEERYERLERAFRRCDGNGRRCVLAASMVYDLLPALGGEPTGAKLVRKRACTRHYRTFTDSELYIVVGSLKVSNVRAPGEPHRYTLFHGDEISEAS